MSLPLSENFLADFCTSVLLKALKKTDGQAFRGAEVQKSAREFSHGLDFSRGYANK